MNHGVLTDIKSANVSSQAVGNTHVLLMSHTVRAFCPRSSYKLRGQRRDGQRGRSNWGSPEEIMEEAAICNSETLPDAGSTAGSDWRQSGVPSLPLPVSAAHSHKTPKA